MILREKREKNGIKMTGISKLSTAMLRNRMIWWSIPPMSWEMWKKDKFKDRVNDNKNLILAICTKVIRIKMNEKSETLRLFIHEFQYGCE